MKKIPLTKGKFALVDDADYDELAKHKWRVRAEGYAGRLGGGRSLDWPVWMHRQIMGLHPGPVNGVYVDHANHNKLDNRRCNLRIASKGQDVANRGLSRANTTGFKGVYPVKGGYGWKAEIQRGGRFYYLGCHATPQEAARAYDAKALELFGEFARTNAMLGLL